MKRIIGLLVFTLSVLALSGAERKPMSHDFYSHYGRVAVDQIKIQNFFR